MEHAYWPHYWIGRTATRLNKYKFNFLLKGFLIYSSYKGYAEYYHAKNNRFLGLDEMIMYSANIVYLSALTGTALMLF